MTQLSTFDTPAKRGYSWDTSYPALKENPQGKALQAEKVYEVIKRLGETCLLQISEELGMEQGRVSARMSDLISAGRVRYSGKEDYISYKGRIRKKIIVNQ